MEKPNKSKVIVQFVLLLVLVVVLSWISTIIWKGKPETIPPPKKLDISSDMTVVEFGQKNGLPNTVLKQIFPLQAKEDLQKKIGSFNLSTEEISTRINKALASP